MFIENYTLIIFRETQRLKLSVSANDHNHAQAQSVDITRSLQGEKSELTYGKIKETILSDLFRRLAFSDFDRKECFKWPGSFTNGVPSLYALGKRFYVRPLIQKYLDLDQDRVVKNTCKNTKCINPYHNHYLFSNNSKLSGGDHQMALAFRSQGVSVPQIALALNVHKSTIYRFFKDAPHSSRIENH